MIQLSMYIGGIVFGLGLAISGAARPEITLSFLRLEDMGLLLVIGIGFFITFISYQLIPKMIKRSFSGREFQTKLTEAVSKRNILGAVIFGIGWGVSGLCPATAITAVGMGNTPILLGVVGMFIGALVYGLWRSRKMNSL